MTAIYVARWEIELLFKELKSGSRRGGHARPSLCRTVPPWAATDGHFLLARAPRGWHRSCLVPIAMKRTVLTFTCLLAVSLLYIGCSGSTATEGSDPEGSGAADGTGGAATGGAGVGGTYDDEDRSWTPVADVVCEDFDGLEPDAFVQGVAPGEQCYSLEWTQASLAGRGIDFEILEDGPGGAGGESSDGCPSPDLVFPDGIHYGGGC